MSDDYNVAPSVWDTAISVRQIARWLLLILLVATVWYVWQFFRLAWYSEVGGVSVKSSPYFEEIPKECRGAADRHRPTNSDGILADKFAMRLKPLRIPADRYLNPEYRRISCFGYAVLTGLHVQDSMDADFTDTYVDGSGKPIVRIRVEYLQPYSYTPSRRRPLTDLGTK